jgi:DNA-binding NarL/FixJ family response regulator
MPVQILIADDNAQVRTAMREVLEAAGGWEIIEAKNGEEAVIKAREFKPGLIILDLAMPAKDGLTASREISEELPGVPILMHTLYSSRQIQIEAAKTGVRKVVAKSETTALISAVQDVLNPSLDGVPSEDPSLVQAEHEAARHRTEDRIRELCIQILQSNDDAALPATLLELRDTLHAHIESFRARLAEYPAIPERRARNCVSSTSVNAKTGVAEPAKTGKSDAKGEALPIADAGPEGLKSSPESKVANGG